MDFNRQWLIELFSQPYLRGGMSILPSDSKPEEKKKYISKIHRSFARRGTIYGGRKQ
jgi:hypothetical protein